jgi:hypothetical protein
MAQISSTTLSGSILLPTTENTSSAGNIWFDGTNVKYSTLGAGTWSAGGNMQVASYLSGATGTQNAGLAFPLLPSGDCTIEYDGSSWSGGGTLNASRTYTQGAGTQNSATAFGGRAPSAPSGPLTCTEEYNGTSWTTATARNNATENHGGTGCTQDTALAIGGDAGLSCTEEYNGSTWSNGGALITGRRFNVGFGSQNAGMTTGGFNPSYLTSTELYNGTSWSSAASGITARRLAGGFGGQDSAVYAAGYTSGGMTGVVEIYDGSAWSSGPGISARYTLAGTGIGSAGFVMGGESPPIAAISNTEEYNQSITACTL